MAHSRRFVLLGCFLLGACSSTPRAPFESFDAGATQNGIDDDDAGGATTPDAGPPTVSDAGGYQDGGLCALGFVFLDGRCTDQRYSWRLTAQGVAVEADTVFAGEGTQPILLGQLLDPEAIIPADVLMTLRVTQADSGLTFAKPLGKTLSREGDGGQTVRAVLDTRLLAEATYAVRAFLDLDGGSIGSNALTLVVDHHGPSLTLSLPGYDGGLLPRDFVAEVELHAYDAVSELASLTVQGAGPAVDHASGHANAASLVAEWPVRLLSGSGSEQFAAVTIHGADIPLETAGDQAGQIVLLATATDLAGNATQEQLWLPLTRLKWSTTNVTSSRDGLVIGGTGRIYGASAFDIWGLEPTGDRAWHASPGRDATTRAAPMVRARGSSSEVLDVSTVDFTTGIAASRIDELCGDGSAACADSSFEPVLGATLGTAPIPYETGTGRAHLETLIAYDDARCGFDVWDGFGDAPRLMQGLDAGDGSPCFFHQLAVSGSVVAAAGDRSNALYTVDDGGLSFQAEVGSGVWYSDGVAFCGSIAWFTAGNQLIAVDSSSSPPSMVTTFTAGAAVSAPVIDHDGNVYLTSYDGELTKLDATGNLVWSVTLPGPDHQTGSPTVGEDGTIYLVDGTEALDAYDSEGHLLWKTASQFAAPIRSPMIDPCTRTLYVSKADLSGIEAVIVDSAGLDLSGHAWPVYRHDYFGTANADDHPSIDCADHL
jgi:hypothetical protein